MAPLHTVLKFFAWSFLKRNRLAAELRPAQPEASHVPRPPLWQSGTAALKWWRGREHELRVRWKAPDVDLGVSLFVNAANDDSQLRLALGLGLASIVFRYEGNTPAWWPQKWSEQRALCATFSRTGWLSWNLWQNDQMGSSDAPKWRRFSGDIRDIVFGRERIVKTERDTHMIGVPTTRGIVPCLVTEASVLVDRPRWPEARWTKHYEVRVAPLEHRGGLRDCSLAAVDWHDLVGKLVAMASDTRRGWLSFEWKPTFMHCSACGGLGLSADQGTCKVCRGDTLRPLHELARLAIVEACREVPESEKETTIEVRMRAFRAVEQLVQRAELSIANAAPAQACTALISSAVLMMALGRLGAAAAAAGKALGCAVTLEQAAHAQRLLSLISRMPPLHPPRMQILAQDTPQGDTIAIPNWQPEAFAELLGLQDDANSNWVEAWRDMNALVQDLMERAAKAGWTKGTPLGDFVQRLMEERNGMSDRLTLALSCLRDLQRMAIPEGPEGAPLRELSTRATALLSPSA